MTSDGEAAPAGIALFAYDGSQLAKRAIVEAARQLVPGRDALILCVWQPVDVGFVPVDGPSFDADNASDVRAAAERTAADGASLAERVGFRAQGIETQAAPTWKGIVEVADQRDVSLIVLGSHGRSGIAGHIFGSVASAVAGHCGRSVLIVHRPA